MRLLTLLLFTLGIVLGAVRGIQAEPTPPLTSPSATKLQSLLQSDSGTPHFLPVNEAFRPRLRQSAGELQIDWQVAAGYYLYRDRFKFRLIAPAGVTLGTPRFPDAVEKEDELFGKVAVFDHDFTLTLPTSVTSDAEVLLEVEFQGCAEAGLCYPPERLQLGSATPPAAAGSATTEAANSSALLAQKLASARFSVVLGLFFLAGIGLSFTPCVLPMIPILSSIVVGREQHPTRMQALLLTLLYVVSMALTLAVAGALTGLFGARLNLQAYLQWPPLLVGFALLFVLLSLSMFGLYELQLPAALRNRFDQLNRQMSHGHLLGAMAMGALSTLVISPCVSAPLAGALVYISTTQDAWLGGAALFALGLGMGVPLLLLATLGNHLLPKAGAWMERVKSFFGLLLLGVAVWLLERLLPGPVTLLLWAALLLGGALLLGALEFTAHGSGWHKLGQTLGLLLLAWAVALVLGAAAGGSDPLRPLHGLGIRQGQAAAVEHPSFTDITDLPGLDRQLTLAAGRITLVDVYADWCIACKVLEREVFPTVTTQLAPLHRLRADITDYQAPQRALLDRYRIVGPPTLLFLDAKGQELPDSRIVGEIDATQLASHLARLLSR
ncbi:MAG: protein-disulfide reductase DsbD [Pseudomonadales bacterium]|nr:protein-disulfide reductase DsbD [Pseudomonadales bacterium]